MQSDGYLESIYSVVFERQWLKGHLMGIISDTSSAESRYRIEESRFKTTQREMNDSDVNVTAIQFPKQNQSSVLQVHEVSRLESFRLSIEVYKPMHLQTFPPFQSIGEDNIARMRQGQQPLAPPSAKNTRSRVEGDLESILSTRHQ